MRCFNFSKVLIGILVSVGVQAEPLTVEQLQRLTLRQEQCWRLTPGSVIEPDAARQYALKKGLVTPEGYHFMAAYRYMPIISPHDGVKLLCYVSDHEKDFAYHVQAIWPYLNR